MSQEFWEEGTPFNLNWGYENRTCGFRVPNFNSAQQARIENRLCGSDVNPYLAISATLAAGYLGIKKKRERIRFFEIGRAHV